jgi:hypothetical protein
MKLNRKNILACALCAGLLTVGTAKTQATVIGNELVLNLNVQLTALTTSSRGKVQKTRIGNKDLLNSIGDTTKGDTLVYWFDTDHVYVMSKRGILGEDLTSDGTFEISFSQFFSDSNGNKRVFTGTTSAFFANAGAEDTADSDLWFDLDGTYSWTETESGDFGPNNNFFESDTVNMSNLGNEGFDDNISVDDVPLSGSISMSGSGILVD